MRTVLLLGLAIAALSCSSCGEPRASKYDCCKAVMVAVAEHLWCECDGDDAYCGESAVDFATEWCLGRAQGDLTITADACDGCEAAVWEFACADWERGEKVSSQSCRWIADLY